MEDRLKRRKATAEEHERGIDEHYTDKDNEYNPLVAVVAVYQDGTEIEFDPGIILWGKEENLK